MKIPKYVQVRNALLSDIRSGRLKEGDKLPPRAELASRFSVTLTTIEKAMRELLETETLRSTKRLGTFVAKTEVPMTAAVITTVRDKVFPPAVVPDPNDTIGMFKTMLVNAGNVRLSFFDFRETAAARDFDVTVWVQPPEDILERVARERGPNLLVNRYRENVSFVATNHRQAVRELTAHLIGRCSDTAALVYLNPNRDDFIDRERREGFLEACAASGRFYRFCPVFFEHERLLEALRHLPLDADRQVVMVSPSMHYTGAVLRYLSENPRFKLRENFFYGDFDNAYSLERSGVPIPSIVQDYPAMGEAVIDAIRRFHFGLVRCFVPYRTVHFDA